VVLQDMTEIRKVLWNGNECKKNEVMRISR